MNIEIREAVQVRKAILAFSGWPDAGELVRHTLDELHQELPCTRVARWDLDGYWALEASRPQVTIKHGQIQRLQWPAIDFTLCRPEGAEPFLIGFGPEPTTHWRAFASDLLELLGHWQCREILLLGSLFDQVFHDEALLSGVANDSNGLNQLHAWGCEQIDYTGSAAVHSAIMEAAREHGPSCLSLWAHLAFYLNGPHELLTSRILEILGQALGIVPPTESLLERWAERLEQIEALIDQDPELRQTVESIHAESDSPRRPKEPTKVVRLDEFLKRREDRLPDGE